MPYFKTSDNYSIYYEVYESILPSTTMLIHGNLSSVRWWYPSLKVVSHNKNPEVFNKAILLDSVCAAGFPFPEARRNAFKLMLKDKTITAKAISAAICNFFYTKTD